MPRGIRNKLAMFQHVIHMSSRLINVLSWGWSNYERGTAIGKWQTQNCLGTKTIIIIAFNVQKQKIKGHRCGGPAEQGSVGGVLIDYAATIREAINNTWPGSHACSLRLRTWGQHWRQVLLVSSIVLHCPPGVDNLNGSAKRVMGLGQGSFWALVQRGSWPGIAGPHNCHTKISFGKPFPYKTPATFLMRVGQPPRIISLVKCQKDGRARDMCSQHNDDDDHQPTEINYPETWICRNFTRRLQFRWSVSCVSGLLCEELNSINEMVNAKKLTIKGSGL